MLKNFGNVIMIITNYKKGEGMMFVKYLELIAFNIFMAILIKGLRNENSRIHKEFVKQSVDLEINRNNILPKKTRMKQIHINTNDLERLYSKRKKEMLSIAISMLILGNIAIIVIL